MIKHRPGRNLSLFLCVTLIFSLFTVKEVDLYAATGEAPEFSTTSLYNRSVSDAPKVEAPEFGGELTIDTSKRLSYEDIKNARTTSTEKSLNSYDTSANGEESYIESVIEALSEPVGAVGLDSVRSDETVDVIVWLQELPSALTEAYGHDRAAKAASYSANGARARMSIKASHKSRIKFEYSDVFAGFAMNATADEIKALSETPGVYAVIPDTLMYADTFTPDPYYELIGMDESRKALRIGELHTAGLTGKHSDGTPVVVGVLDTGIDYNHPDLRDVYKGGYNFILPGADYGRPAELAYSPMETTYIQWQNSGQPEINSKEAAFYTSHGTHVSGTIAAQAKNGESAYKALGMAPEVDLYAARVLGPYGSGATSGIIAAVNDFAAEGGELPKADVINLSLGADNNSAYGADVFALNNAVIAGLNVAVSAGNNAGASADERQTLTLGTPGTAYLPVTVAASQHGGTVVKTYDTVVASAYPTDVLPTLQAFELETGIATESDGEAEPVSDYYEEPAEALSQQAAEEDTDNTDDSENEYDAAGGELDLNGLDNLPNEPTEVVETVDMVEESIVPKRSAMTVAAAADTTFGLLVEGQNPSNIFKDGSIEGSPAPEYIEGKGYEAYLSFGEGDTNPTLEQLEEIPDDSLDGKILVVKRGLPFTDFLAQAIRTGAGALVVVNSAAGGEEYIKNMAISGTRPDSLPLFSACHSTSAMLTALSEEGTVYIELGSLTKTPLSYEPAYFSSIGPVRETAGLKPDIIAPGWQIVSTQPAFIVNPDHNPDDYSAAYASMNGTSMSAPHIAGILALMKQKYPDASPAEIKARLMNTESDLIVAMPGKEASVFEVGAGFVNPYRALVEDTAVYVTVTDDIPGASSGDVIPDQTLSSLSFGYVRAGESTRTIPVTVHGAASYSVDAVYNNNTRYSNSSAENDVTLEIGADTDNTFEVWAEIPANAAEGYYEGRLKITANGNTYVVPWAVCVGEPTEQFVFDFVAERPIVSTSEDNSMLSSAYANATTLWFMWEGYWPDGMSDILLIDAATGRLAYLYGTLGISGEGDGNYYFVCNAIGTEAYPIDADGALGDLQMIEDGAYYVAMTVGSQLYYSSGVVFSGEQPTLALDTDIEIDNDPSVTTVTVEGQIYSPALALAEEHGFTWDGAYYISSDEGLPLDQSWSVLAFSSANGTGDIIVPYPCDEEGNFQLLLSGITQEDKAELTYLFTGGNNHTVIGIEGYGYNIVPDGAGFKQALHGSNKSTEVTPRLKPVGMELISLTLDNDNGKLTAEIENALPSCPETDFTLEFTLDGTPYAASLYSYSLDSGTYVATAEWTYTPPLPTTDGQTLEASLTYESKTLTDTVTIAGEEHPHFYDDRAEYDLVTPGDVQFGFSLGKGIYAASEIASVENTSAAGNLTEGVDYEYGNGNFAVKRAYLEQFLTNAADAVSLEVSFNNPASTSAQITIEAVYGPVTVTFNSNGGGYVAPIMTSYGTAITEPAAPSRFGYRFNGWYEDSELITLWDFRNAAVLSNITLYAGWLAIPSPSPSGGGGGGGQTARPASSLVSETVSSSVIQSAIRNNTGAIVLEIGNNNIGASISNKDINDIIKSGAALTVKNGLFSASYTARELDELKANGNSSLTIILAPSEAKMSDETAEKLFGTVKGSGFQLIGLHDVKALSNGKSTGKTTFPTLVTIDVSDMKLTGDQKSKFTGFIFDEKTQTYRLLGGEFSDDGKSFVFYTYESGAHGVTVADELMKLYFEIGSNTFLRNGRTQENDVAPYITGDRSMAPLRAVAEGLGADVEWVAETRTVIIRKNEKAVMLSVDMPLPNGMGTAVINGDRTFVPLRYISEALGANVVWEDKVIRIYQ